MNGQDLSQYSDEELQRIANQGQRADLSSYSDEELQRIAKQQSIQQPKSLYEMWGMQMTPEQEKTIPGRIAKFGQETVATPLLHFLNQAGINYPRYMASQFGESYPEATTLPGKILSKGVGVAGAVMSPVIRAIMRMFGLGQGFTRTMGLGEKIARGATSGAVISGAYGQPMAQRPISAVIGGVVGGVVPLTIGAFKKMGDAFEFIPKTNEKEIGLANTVRAEIAKSKQDAVNEFGSAIDNLAKENPTRTISLRETVDEINLDPELSVEARNIFNKTPILRDLLKNPDLSDNVSLKDTQEIINYINTKVPSNVKASHIDILDHLGDIKASQLDAFTEMADVRTAYGELKNSYKIIKPGLKAGNLLENLAKDWKDPEIKKAFESLINNPETLKSIENYQNALRILHITGLLTKTAVVGSIGAETYNIVSSLLRKK